MRTDLSIERERRSVELGFDFDAPLRSTVRESEQRQPLKVNEWIVADAGAEQKLKQERRALVFKEVDLLSFSSRSFLLLAPTFALITRSHTGSTRVRLDNQVDSNETNDLKLIKPLRSN